MPRAPVRKRLLGGVVALSVATSVALAQGVPSRSPSAATCPLSGAQITRQAPDDFGTTDYTVTVIPATSFTSDDQYVTDYGSLSRYFPFADEHRHYFVGLSQIPSGAIIDFVGLECASTAGGELKLTPFSVDQSSGTTSGIVVLPNTPHDFDTDYNANPLGWQLVQNVHNAIVLDVDQAPHSEPLFGWVEIWWKRPVSPAPATPTFGDVPGDDFGYPYVEALSSSGVTGGCGNGDYCPDRNVTRREMAIFLSKALGLHWPY